MGKHAMTDQQENNINALEAALALTAKANKARGITTDAASAKVAADATSRVERRTGRKI